MAPKAKAKGQATTQLGHYVPCEEIIVYKQGLDLRLKEFMEEKRRIVDTQWRLQRAWDEKIVDSVVSLETDLRGYSKPLRTVLQKQTDDLRNGAKSLAVVRISYLHNNNFFCRSRGRSRFILWESSAAGRLTQLNFFQNRGINPHLHA